MHGLFEVDITTARRLLAAEYPPLSLTAFVVASLGRAPAGARLPGLARETRATPPRRSVKADSAKTSGRLLQTVAPILGRVPGVYQVMFATMRRSRRIHMSSGTVQVTAVGMFADGGGFAIAPPTLASLVVVVGGLSTRPCATEARVEVRDVLDLTVTVDHNVIDGAPATRFAAEFRRALSTAAVLDQHRDELR
jgi:hypothetical protein